MNRTLRLRVQFFMRVYAIAIAVPLLFSSCSSSRTVDADRVVEPGRHVSRSVMGSDILIGKGSVLDVSFSSGNRFFVGTGGALIGFQSGVRNTQIYAERGAHLPEKKYLSEAQVITVPSANRSFRDRFNELPALTGGSLHSEEDSYLDDEDCDDDDHHHRSRGPRAVSVTPDSYKSKD